MKRILLCLLVIGSSANAALIGFHGAHRVLGWAFMEVLWHQRFGRANEIMVVNPLFHLFLLQQADPDLVDAPMRNKLEKEARRAQKLEARENEKRAWRQARHHDNHLPKNNKWVCQQARSKNH